MIGILLTAVLSNSTGQIENCGPVCNQGSYCALIGTYIGPYPTASFCAQTAPCYGYSPGYPGGYAGGYGAPMGGYGGYPGGFGMGGGQNMLCGPPIVLPPGYSLVKDEDKSKDNSREQRDIQRQLDEIKGSLEKDVKGTLEKLTESLKQTDKRLDNAEKVGLGTEADVKWLKEQIKERFFWHDMESKLDQRIKPIEERLRELNKNLDKHDERMRRQHEEWLRSQIQPGKSTEGKAEDGFKSIESRIDKLQGTILKEVMGVMTRIEELEESLKTERALRAKIEERLKNIEKSLAPNTKEEPKDKEAPKEDKKDKEAPKDEKKEAPKDKDGAIGLSKARLAQVSMRHEGVPANKALVVVSLPADARLYLNDQLTRAAGTTRTFVTPDLEPGGIFTYTFRMEVFQNGALRTQTQNVSFQAGQRVSVAFGFSNELNVAGAQR